MQSLAGQLPTLTGVGGGKGQHLGGPNPCLTWGHVFHLHLVDGGEGSDYLGRGSHARSKRG